MYPKQPTHGQDNQSIITEYHQITNQPNTIIHPSIMHASIHPSIIPKKKSEKKKASRLLPSPSPTPKLPPPSRDPARHATVRTSLRSEASLKNRPHCLGPHAASQVTRASGRPPRRSHWAARWGWGSDGFGGFLGPGELRGASLPLNHDSCERG